MKETQELFDSIFDTLAQGVVSFRDGFQLTEDVPDFVDELLSWPNAINGIKLMKDEAMVISVEQVDALFGKQRDKLMEAGMHPMLAGSIVSGAQTSYFVYAAIAQSGQPASSPKYAEAYRNLKK